MEITEVKIVLKEGPDKKLKAYATLTIDSSFVIRNMKIINGNKGLFVAMPSRKMREACSKCHYKNTIRSKFCNQCGANLPLSPPRDVGQEIRQSEHRDIAHPITLECREYIQKKVLEAYNAEANKSAKHPDISPKAPDISPKVRISSPETSAPKEKPEEEKKPLVEDLGDIAL